MSVMAAALPSLPTRTSDPILSWLTFPLARRPTAPCGCDPTFRKRRRCGCPPRTSGALPGVRGGDKASPRSVAIEAVSGRATAATSHATSYQPSAVVAVPSTHAAWLTAASLRYNDGKGGAALNKKARNAVEWATAVLSVEAVVLLATAWGVGPPGRGGPVPSAGSGHGDFAEDGNPPLEGDETVAAAGRLEHPATALPAQRICTVRLASAPLQFVDAVAARLGHRGGLCGCGGGGGGSSGAGAGHWRSISLGRLLTAVQR